MKGHLSSDSSVSGKAPGWLHSRCHKSESEPGWRSEGSHSPAGARGLALGKDFPGAALSAPFLLLILLGEGKVRRVCSEWQRQWGQHHMDLQEQTAGAELGNTGSPPNVASCRLPCPPTCPWFLAYVCPVAWVGMPGKNIWPQLIPLALTSLPPQPGSPILTPGLMSGTHLPASDHWAEPNFVLNSSLRRPGLAEASVPTLPSALPRHPTPLSSWPWQEVLSGPRNNTSLPGLLG